jgi:uncharacterized membrane protein
MAPITGTIEISRPAPEVFDYISDLQRHTEWQSALESVAVESAGPVRLGTEAVETRRVPGGTRRIPYEITVHERPNRMAFQVTDGAVRARGSMTLTSLDSGTRTRVGFEIEFEGHGLGVLLLPFVRRDARHNVAENLAALKARLESDGQLG